MNSFDSDVDRWIKDEILYVPLNYSQTETMFLPNSITNLVSDQDTDIVMSDTAASTPPISPFRDKFNFEWFSFDGRPSSAVTPLVSSRTLSISTASPTSYFIDSPTPPEIPARNAFDLDERGPTRIIYPPPPSEPLRWIWQCHLCRSQYPLAATRRCLVDGHYYCSGNTQTQRNVKKRQRQQSCTSEFDYVAWKEWGRWRRKTLALRAYANGKPEPKMLGCGGCSSPSQCRYEKRDLVEIVKFDDFIEPEDLVMDEERTIDMSENRSEGRYRTSIQDLAIPSRAEKIGKSKRSGAKKNLRIDLNPSSSFSDQKNTKRHRFYSSLTASLSEREPSPTSETLDPSKPGRFDPTLPSLTPPNEGVSGDQELVAIESPPKAALVNPKPLPPSPRPPEVSTYLSKPAKKRVNSKVNDPGYEIASKDGQLTDHNAALPRTNPQQSLLTDFFRNTRGANLTTQNKPAAHRAASESDIAAFLRPKTGHDDEEESGENSRIGSPRTSHGKHLEDTELSPGRIAVSKEKLSPAESRFADTLRPEPDSETSYVKPVGEGQSSRLGMVLGIPAFVFGRR